MTNSRPNPLAPDDLAIGIATKDNMRTIGRVLEGIAGLGGRLIVVDSGSTDGTIQRCEAVGATVIHRQWEGMVSQRRFILEQCAASTWTLILDSDEYLDATLREAIREAVTQADIAGFEMRRKVLFRGHVLDHVFQPEWRMRLFRSAQASVSGAGIDGKGGHDRILVDGPVGKLGGVCLHDSWETTEHMLERQLAFARRSARYIPKQIGVCSVLAAAPLAFLKQYVLKGGFRDGRMGFQMCAAFALGTGMKKLLTYAADHPQDETDPTRQ